jgi:hypothetical protein
MFIELTGRELYNYSLDTVIELLHELKKEKSQVTRNKTPFQDVASGDGSVLCWLITNHEADKALTLAWLRQRRSYYFGVLQLHGGWMSKRTPYTSVTCTG